MNAKAAMSVKTPAIRGNKNSNSRRGVQKLTPRRIKTNLPGRKHTDNMKNRKHKTSTTDYMNEEEFIDNMVREELEEYFHDDHDEYQMFHALTCNGLGEENRNIISSNLLDELEEKIEEEGRILRDEESEEEFQAILLDLIEFGNQWLEDDLDNILDMGDILEDEWEDEREDDEGFCDM
jgi:hypothetical protein